MNIYFSGISGVGLGPLAEIAKDAGYNVVGSDIEESLMTAKLRDDKIEIRIGAQDGTYLREQHAKNPIDWFVYTPALKSDNPELLLARELGIRIAKRGEMLAHIIKISRQKLIAISGTHGKTTTTGMFVWALKQLNIPISYSIGTTINFGPSGKFDPNAEYFVYECDEFDRNMLYFSPFLAVVPALSYDHPDTYPKEQDYLDAFRQFANQSDNLIGWKSQNGKIFDGLSQVSLLDDSEVNSKLKLAGLHNRRNATLVQYGIKKLGIDINTDEILSNFPGTDRRFEKLADNLYSDYGHHPIEIASTLQLARELSDQIVLVYQPHQNIRQHELLGKYTNQFELAEKIYWLPTYLSREDPNLDIIAPKELFNSLTNKAVVSAAEFDDELWKNIEEARRNGKMVVCMGAGAIDGWVRDKLQDS